MKTDTGGSAFPIPGTEQGHIPNGTWNQTYEPPTEGMTLLDAAALAAFPEKLRIYSSDKAAQHAYHAAEEFVAEKRRREE